MDKTDYNSDVIEYKEIPCPKQHVILIPFLIVLVTVLFVSLLFVFFYFNKKCGYCREYIRVGRNIKTNSLFSN